ncbi:MAG: DNA-processing protein DprA [Thermoleophilia bacterium]
MSGPVPPPRRDRAPEGAAAHWPLGLAWLAHRLGRDLQRAARRAGGPDRLWTAGRERFEAALRLPEAELAAARAARDAFDPGEHLRRLAAEGIAHVPLTDPAYPASLAAIHDPPFGLFVTGTGVAALDAIAGGPAIAVVGSRRATAEGRAFTRRLAGDLADRGAVVVSGLAHGIDAAAHEGAVAADGVTVAVLGCGVDVPYPRRNGPLAARIRRSGAVVSEYWPGTVPAPWRFPARNRIVAGLADAVAVVEAGRRSGALITADFGLELGRPVLAVPGWPGTAASEGCNALLRAGAALLEGADDVVAELPGLAWAPPPGLDPGPGPTGLPGRIHAALQREPMTPEGLAEALDEDPSAVAGAIALLEVEGLALRGEGRRYWATPLGGRARSPGMGVRG